MAIQVKRLWEFMGKVWTLALAFKSFTLCPAEGSNSYILPAIFQPISLDLDGYGVKRPLEQLKKSPW